MPRVRNGRAGLVKVKSLFQNSPSINQGEGSRPLRPGQGSGLPPLRGFTTPVTPPPEELVFPDPPEFWRSFNNSFQRSKKFLKFFYIPLDLFFSL
jgi:hypothetical protein